MRTVLLINVCVPRVYVEVCVRACASSWCWWVFRVLSLWMSVCSRPWRGVTTTA